MKDWLNIDLYKLIITEMKQMRKVALMIILFACIICACFDFVLRKHSIVLNWFTMAYIILGIITLCVLVIKSYNAFCKYINEKRIIRKKYKPLKPILDTLNADEEYVLKKFVNYNCTRVILSEQDLKTINYNYDVINTIYQKFKSFGYYLVQCAHKPNLVLTTQQSFFEILKLHFSKN